MTTEQKLTATETLKAIEEQLSPVALAYWNGCVSEIHNEIVTIGQKQGVEAAVAEVEELAK